MNVSLTLLWVMLALFGSPESAPVTESEQALKTSNETDMENFMRLSELTRYFFQGPLSIFQPAYRLPSQLLPDMMPVTNFSQFGRATRVQLPKFTRVNSSTLAPPPSKRTELGKDSNKPNWDTPVLEDLGVSNEPDRTTLSPNPGNETKLEDIAVYKQPIVTLAPTLFNPTDSNDVQLPEQSENGTTLPTTVSNMTELEDVNIAGQSANGTVTIPPSASNSSEIGTEVSGEDGTTTLSPTVTNHIELAEEELVRQAGNTRIVLTPPNTNNTQPEVVELPKQPEVINIVTLTPRSGKRLELEGAESVELPKVQVVNLPRKDSKLIRLLNLKFVSNAKPVGVVIN